jgi:hypothetical protein
VQPQLPPDAALDLLPLAGAAKTESWSVCFLLAHFGQAIAWLLLRTICS